MHCATTLSKNLLAMHPPYPPTITQNDSFLGPFEYYSHMAHTCPSRNRYQESTGMVKKACPRGGGGPLCHPPKPKGAKTPFSTDKAAAISTRGAYSQYVSAAQWREHRWRLLRPGSGHAFSPFPLKKSYHTPSL